MRFSTPSRARLTAAAAGLALLAVACDEKSEVNTPRMSDRPTIGLEVSSRSASAGQQVAVSISNESNVAIGGVQGVLKFDGSRLKYRGQIRSESSDEVLMVNAARAAEGELRLATLDAGGLVRTGSLVFEVVGGEYASSLSFSVDEAMANGSPVRRIELDVARGVEVNTNLQTAGDIKQLGTNEWLQIVKSRAAKGASFSRDPGEIRDGLKYGDTNMDGTLTLGDAVYLINVSLAINEMIIGTDGTGPLGDRDAVVAGNVFPFGPPVGIEANGTRVISLGDAVAIINESIGIDQPQVGTVIPGRPVTPVTARQVVTGSISTNTTWTNDKIWELQGSVTVTGGATLTIQPGTVIEGQRGTFCGPPTCPAPGVSTNGSALFIARDGRLVADGTPLQPIVMTCVAGPTPRAKGCWGGMVVMGNAILNDGFATSPNIPGRSGGSNCLEKPAEGGAGNYGGCNDTDDSGIFRYLRVEYAGFRFNPLNELNGIAFCAVGSGTIIDFVQVHAGLDDGIEMFGGTVNMKHLVLTANEDDSFDYTEGYRGKVQFVIIQHDPLDSDKGTEQDNWENGFDALPRAEPVFYNWTMIGKPDPTSTAGVAGNNSIAAFNIRRGARPHFFNVLAQNWRAVMDIDDASTVVNMQTATGFELKNSIFAANLALADPDGSDPTDEALFITGQATNSVVATSPLLSPLDFMVPDWRPAFGTATGGATPPNDGFFDVSATFIGAVAPATATKNNIPWYSGWTRGWQNPTTP